VFLFKFCKTVVDLFTVCFLRQCTFDVRYTILELGVIVFHRLIQYANLHITCMYDI